MTQPTYTSPKLFIAGEWIATTGRSRPILNPATSEEIGAVPLATSELVTRALAAAEAGFEVWRKTPMSDRSAIMKRAAAELRATMDEAVAHLVMDMGKPIAEARSELENCAILLEWCPDAAAEVVDRVLPARNGFRDMRVRHEPIGPVLAIAPWNFPASLAGRKMASALAVGCSVIVRPATDTPAAFGYIARALDSAGLPKGVLQVLYGDPETTIYPLLDSPVIRKLAFTGSTEVGCMLASRAAAKGKPSVMELGGHAPVIVTEDADIERAIALSVASKFRNSGQVCVSPTRYFVHETVAETFTQGFVAGAKALRVGDGLDPKTQMGPVANERRLEAINSLVRDAELRGAKVRAGGTRLNKPGSFYAPTILTDVPDDARVMQEEPFGPLAIINRYTDLDAVITAANNTPYALGAYAFTSNDATAEKLVVGLDAGMIGINSYTIVATDSPIGGRRMSGFGSEGGPEGIAAYLIPKFSTLV